MMKKKLLSAVLVLSMLLSTIAVPAFAASDEGRSYAYKTVSGLDLKKGISTSFLPFSQNVWFVDNSGRICLFAETSSKTFKIYTFDDDYNVIAEKSVPLPEKSIYGGFYKAPDGNCYLAVGYKNTKEDPSKVVVEVLKLDGSYNQVGKASALGGSKDTTLGIKIPFEAATPDMVLVGDALYLHMARIMFKSEDGLSHQANITFEIDTKTMTAVTLVEKYGQAPYSSHSFAQIIRQDGDDVVTADLGDAYPRGIVLTVMRGLAAGKKPKVIFKNIFPFDGQKGYQHVGTTISGVECSDKNYFVIGTSFTHGKAINGKNSDYNGAIEQRAKDYNSFF
ncbi:MAG: hypothetical protein RR051_07265, partial [Clostridiales bacterium]